MSDYKDNAMVVQSNKFVRGSYNTFTANEIKCFDLFVSCIDVMNPKNTVEISKQEFFKALRIEPDYRRFKEITEGIMTKVWYYIDDEKRITNNFVQKVIWFNKEDRIFCKFSDDIMPMLVDLKTNFLQYSFHDLNCFHSKYSMILYKYVLSYIRQYRILSFYVDLDELRKVLNLTNKYKEFRDFNKKVLIKFVSEINNSMALQYLVDYEKCTKGKKVIGVRFKVRPRTANSETNFNDVKNPIMYEEMCSKMLKDGANILEIRNRQADAIINKGE